MTTGMGTPGPLLTVAEVADLLRVSNMTVYRLIKGGQIGAIRVGKNYRIRGRELSDYIDASFEAVAREARTADETK